MSVLHPRTTEKKRTFLPNNPRVRREREKKTQVQSKQKESQISKQTYLKTHLHYFHFVFVCNAFVTPFSHTRGAALEEPSLVIPSKVLKIKLAENY